jgi:hypothetical protein
MADFGALDSLPIGRKKAARTQLFFVQGSQ